jgi:hypothetical protein
MALNANIAWEIRQAGSANNGGGFRNNLFQTPPSAPAVSGSGSGGTVAAGTYYCAITYTPGIGGETPISGETAVTLSGTTSSITVTHPTDPGNGATWNLYVGTTSGGPYFPQGTALAIGSNRVVTTTPSTTGTQPAGTDRTLSTSPFVAIDNSAVTTSITTNVITFTGGYIPTGADVGNVVHMLTGTNVTAGFKEIVGVTSTTWIMDSNVVSSGTTTNATGNMGGAIDYPGTVQAVAVTNNVLMTKYSATAYSFAAGLTFSQSQLTICGYDTTRALNNTDANRPIFNPTANSLLLFNCNNRINFFNIDFVNTTPRTGTQGISLNNGTARNCRFNTYQNYAITVSNGYVADCEFISCGSGNITVNMSGASQLVRCIFKACSSTGQGVVLVAAGCSLVDCVSYGHTSTTAFNGPGYFRGCVAYGGTTVNGHGFSNTSGQSANYENCIAYGNAGWGFTGSNQINSGSMVRCFTGANTLGALNPIVIGPYQQYACGTLSGDPFTAAASYDFSPNNAAGAGASIRNLPITSWGGTTTSYLDAGVAQHAAAGGGPVPRIGSSLISNYRT